MKKVLIGGILILLVAMGAWYFVKNENSSPQYKTSTVVKGDLEAAVTATGTVNAVKTVLVGTQVSGTLKELFVDYNSQVRQGQLLAQIDPATFQAQVDQAKANLLNAEANLKKSEASLVDSRRTYERNKKLIAKNYIAQSDLDTAETNVQTAQAQVDIARAQVLQNRAALTQAETSLHYTRILSPVKGIVISRNVDVGQTVAASFQTPTLFTIAEDLTKMQIDTSVDEADISKVKVNQEVRFTVDAYPDTNFIGNVSEIRNAATMVQNVVTYDVVVQVNNSNLKLKPGMTANVSIITARKAGILLVPNSALRFKPKTQGETQDASLKKTSKAGRGLALWVLENNKPKRISVKMGISDGSSTEIVSGQITEGQAVIVSMNGQTDKQQSSSPPPPRLFH
jgi:HlyD family secretion protein